jgi:hypothetical protein
MGATYLIVLDGSQLEILRTMANAAFNSCDIGHKEKADCHLLFREIEKEVVMNTREQTIRKLNRQSVFNKWATDAQELTVGNYNDIARMHE